MEIYRNDTTTPVQLKVPVTPDAGTTIITATDASGVLYTFTGIAFTSGMYSFALPFGLVDKDRKFTINWSFKYTEAGIQKDYSSKTYVEVTTPYVTVEEIQAALGTLPATITPDDLIRVERRIRGVIDNYTGQAFGYYTGKKAVQSTGDEDLILPQRLISLSAVDGAYFTDVANFETRGDGWFLGRATNADGTDRVWDTVLNEWRSKDPICPPGTLKRGLWKDNVVYTVTGEWGYEDVPFNVKEAALILIEDNLCPDSEYRDRYIDGVKTADYQYTYTPGAFRGTGSVIADQLLEPYRRSRLVVI
jgi:hypothetical protein